LKFHFGKEFGNCYYLRLGSPDELYYAYVILKEVFEKKAMQRSQNNTCLLCEVNKATKRKSHIVSKFLGKSITNKNERFAYEIDTSRPNRIPKKVQDSPKEDFLLCPQCEKYLEHLETYFANNLHHKILDDKFNHNFNYGISEGGIEHAICLNHDNNLLRLFVFSLYWRASISETNVFRDFKVQQERMLRQILVNSKSDGIDEIKRKTPHSKTFELSMVILRTKSKTGNSQNVIQANNSCSDPYMLDLNEYIFLLSWTNTPISTFGNLVNYGNSKIIIGLISQDILDEFSSFLINLAAHQTLANVKTKNIKGNGFQ